MAKHTKETLGFDSFSGYYASITQGYGGFDWGSVDYMNATVWQNENTEWCDTGYQNAIHGTGEAFTFNKNGYTSTGFIGSSNPGETFTLNSMVAASAWETKQAFAFNSYVYNKHGILVLKASDEVHLSQTAQTIDFAKIGKPGDFQNITAVTIVSGSGKYGNTCSYGPYSYTLGNEMAFDNLKVTWNGTIPKGNGKSALADLAARGHGHATHVATAHLVHVQAHHDASQAIHTDAALHSGASTGSHSEPPSPGEAHAGDLTGQFHLPAIEHFGT